MNVLVTGAAGFIGYHACMGLRARGHEVIGVDIAANDRKVRLESSDIAVCERDVARESFVDYIDIGCDAIVHLAARTGVADSELNPAEYIRSNILGTQRVFEMAHTLGIKRVVYASSSSVYGSASATDSMTEDMAGHGLKSIYAMTKLAQEHVAGVWATKGIEAIGLRFFSVYGPMGRPDNVIARAIDSVMNGTEMSLYGRGAQIRDFTSVDDVVRAVAIAVEMDMSGWSGVMNIGRGVPVTVFHVVSIVEDTLGGRLNIRHEPARACDVEATWADIEMAHRILEWSPVVDVQDGIEKMIEDILTTEKA